MTLLDLSIGLLVLCASACWYRVCYARSGASLGAHVLRGRARRPCLPRPLPAPQYR